MKKEEGINVVSKELVKNIEQKAAQLRLDILDMIGVGKAGHLGGSCSCADIVAALYFHKMKVDPDNPKWEDRDRFLLSKGHAALVQYAALAELGFFSKEEFRTIKDLGAVLQGHPDMTKTPGVEINSGSLGQGLSVANGLGLGLRLRKKLSKVYVIIGDGESQEGQVWEAAMAASNYKIDNVVAVVDNNKLQATGPIKDRFNSNPIAPKWEACGWNVIEIDGHNVQQILEALYKTDEVKGKPTVIIASTIKGKGVSFAENNPGYHYGSMSEEQYEAAKKELEKLLV